MQASWGHLIAISPKYEKKNAIKNLQGQAYKY